MNDQEDLENQDLDNLRNEFTGHGIWRAIRRDGSLGDWVACLHDKDAGVDLTVIGASAAELRAALIQDRERAARGVRRLL